MFDKHNAIHLSICVGGPYDNRAIVGVDQWLAWVPRNLSAPGELSRPIRNMPREEVTRQSHYIFVGRNTSGQNVYNWKRVDTSDARPV